MRSTFFKALNKKGDISLVIRDLNEGQDVNELIEHKLPLSIAVRNENVALAELLIMRGANLNKTDEEGKTPLFYARGKACVNLLLQHKADPTIKNNAGVTPLDYFKTRLELNEKINLFVIDVDIKPLQDAITALKTYTGNKTDSQKRGILSFLKAKLAL